MKSKELQNLGIPRGKGITLAVDGIRSAHDSGMTKRAIRDTVRAVIASPEAYVRDSHFGELATFLDEDPASTFVERPEPAPHRQWGDDIDDDSKRQMVNACRLPISVRGALMPDAHVGYGLPIGGVLATRKTVIPYAVGVDIACRMKMTVLDLPPQKLKAETDKFQKAIERETRFGIGAKFRDKRDHDVMDEDWSINKVTKQVRDRAWSQLGTSGSGNHFVEFGHLELSESQASTLGLASGVYLALLSHSGSRGAGASIAGHYSRLARELHPELPKELGHLSWLDLDSEPGQEYWESMELMGKYAAANHACIHRHLAKNLGARVLLDLENHHNFAWKETHDGEELVVHRKGATPAGKDVLGIIPGSMTGATYIVRGRGNEASLRSAAHGAGRQMSRTKAKTTLKWSDARRALADAEVTLMSAGLDEVPAVYKNIEDVMAAQSDLVEPIGRFWPKLVKMAPAGERPED